MTVKRKAQKPHGQPYQHDIDGVINQAGKPGDDSIKFGEEEVRFTLRIPQKMINKIDKERKARVGNVSRNQWILEAIAKTLK